MITTFLRGRSPGLLRGLALTALTDTAIIYAGTISSDSGGGGTTSWAAVGTTEARIDSLGGGANNRVTGGQIDERSTHVVMAPSDVFVNPAERVVISGRGTYEVTATRQRTDATITVFEVLQVT